MTRPNTDQGVAAEDREAARPWLHQYLRGSDIFALADAFARHRLSSTAALEAEVERWHDAYCIAHDQAMSNGEAYQDATAQIASLRQRLESATDCVQQLNDWLVCPENFGPLHGVGLQRKVATFLQEQEKQNG